jgi:hypothetical protein
LAGTVLNEAGDFAKALAHKRVAEATKAMPAVELILGARMGEMFARYAEVTPLGALRNPAHDALGFIQWVLNGEKCGQSPGERDGLRYEEARIVMRETGRRLMIRWVKVPGSERASRSLVVWWRWGGRLREWASG